MARLTFEGSGGEIWFLPCRFDGAVQDHYNEQGALVTQPTNGALTKSEQLAVDALLAAAAEPESESTVAVADGGSAEVAVHRGRLMLRPRRARPALAKLVYDILAAGHWAFAADDVLVVTNPKHAEQRPAHDPRVAAAWYLTVPSETLVVESPAALAAALGWS